MISRIRQLWIQRKAMVVVALLSMGSGAVLGAVRYSNRFPAIPTFEVKRGEFIDSVQFSARPGGWLVIRRPDRDLCFAHFKLS